MPVRQFFALRKEGIKLRRNEIDLLLHDFCDVVAISGFTSEEYYKDLKKGFWKRVFPNDDRPTDNALVFDAKDTAAHEVFKNLVGQLH